MRKNILIYFCIALIGMGIGGLMVWDQYHDDALPRNHAVAVGAEGELTPARNTPIVTAVKKASPSVVGITNKAYARDIFNRKVRIGEGVGSGVIFDSRGYIVTNHHVIDGAGEIIVSLPDGRTFPGILVGSDPATDLAVVKIEASDLSPATFGDSDTLQVGEPAIAIGNPLGLEFRGSVTAGVISALGRTITVDDQEYNLIQTDAAINPGNSGGALINADGELVGINSAKISASGVEGIGFSIPINTARPIITSLVEKGRVIRPSMGIGVLDSTSAARYGYSIPEGKGLLIVEVSSRGPARQVGIRSGDILRKIDGTEINKLSELRSILENYQVGDVISVEIYRKGQIQSYNIRLEDPKE